jgi:hypothetical protein
MMGDEMCMVWGEWGMRREGRVRSKLGLEREGEWGVGSLVFFSSLRVPDRNLERR